MLAGRSNRAGNSYAGNDDGVAAGCGDGSEAAGELAARVSMVGGNCEGGGG
jgi:hypothetical protein